MPAMPQIQEFEDRSYNPFDSDEINFGSHPNPYPKIAEWRAEGAVLPGSYRSRMGLPDAMTAEGQHFTVVGTAEITRALTEPERFSSLAVRAPSRT